MCPGLLGINSYFSYASCYPGPVIFLEEDHHVAEDFLHVLHLLRDEREKNHKDCDIISMGTYLKSFNFPRTHKAVSEKRLQLLSKIEKESKRNDGAGAYKRGIYRIISLLPSSLDSFYLTLCSLEIYQKASPHAVGFLGGGGRRPVPRISAAASRRSRRLTWAPASSIFSSVLNAFNQVENRRYWHRGMRRNTLGGGKKAHNVSQFMAAHMIL